MIQGKVATHLYYCLGLQRPSFVLISCQYVMMAADDSGI